MDFTPWVFKRDLKTSLVSLRDFSMFQKFSSRFFWFFTKAFFVFSCGCFSFIVRAESSSCQKVRVSMVQTIDHPALNETRRGIIDGLEAAGYKKGDTLTLDLESAQGKPEIAMQIAQKFVGNNPSVLVGIGTTASQALAFVSRKPGIPVVFASVTDPVAAKLVEDIKNPGRLVTGVSNFTPLKPQFRLFKKLVPDLKNLGIIYNPGEANSLILLEESLKTARHFDVNIVAVPALKTAEVSTATRSLQGRVEAIFINNDNTALSAFESVVKEAGKIPVFASDTDLIHRGAYAALGPNQYDLGRQVAQMVVRILRGQKASSLPVEYPKNLETKVRM